MVLAQKQKYRSVKQEESPERNPHTYGLLTYNKKARLCNGRKTVSSINDAGKTGQLHVKKKKKKKKIRTVVNTIHKNKLKMS